MNPGDPIPMTTEQKYQMLRWIGSLDTLATLMKDSNDPLMVMRAPAVEMIAQNLTSLVGAIQQTHSSDEGVRNLHPYTKEKL